MGVEFAGYLYAIAIGMEVGWFKAKTAKRIIKRIKTSLIRCVHHAV